jgi:very-short-patch-repair endonuclease
VRPNIAEPFIGTEALDSAALSRHQLRTRYRAVCPNVYVPRDVQLSLNQRIAASWLWAGRQSTVVGLAACSLHGAKWIDDDVTVELVSPLTRPPPGVLTRRDTLLPVELTTVNGMAVTTPERTAFDVGRREPDRVAVARLDALARATNLKPDRVIAIAEQHPGARGLRRLETALELVDAGAQSQRETYLRLLLIDAGLPRPQTQIAVPVEGTTYYLDMGWPDLMVAVEYDGEHHRTDPLQYRKDIRRLESLARIGWVVIRVIAGDHPSGILARVRRALDARESSV